MAIKIPKAFAGTPHGETVRKIDELAMAESNAGLMIIRDLVGRWELSPEHAKWMRTKLIHIHGQHSGKTSIAGPLNEMVESLADPVPVGSNEA